ncbi:hypothetical protein C8Q76DRAFT_790688 [Earliella scabrosa]|nr:hypothetical protein C8Q76DRAFT_790688 [Earliella scabrosa]
MPAPKKNPRPRPVEKPDPPDNVVEELPRTRASNKTKHPGLPDAPRFDPDIPNRPPTPAAKLREKREATKKASEEARAKEAEQRVCGRRPFCNARNERRRNGTTTGGAIPLPHLPQLRSPRREAGKSPHKRAESAAAPAPKPSSAPAPKSRDLSTPLSLTSSSSEDSSTEDGLLPPPALDVSDADSGSEFHPDDGDAPEDEDEDD